MTAYFVQHGLALEKEKDPNRPLSHAGREDVKRIARQLKRQQVIINEICHSGKTRAEETAQLFAAEQGNCALRKITGMNPNDDIRQFAKNLRFDEVMYVGHLPHLDKLISYLIVGNSHQSIVQFVNSCVVCVKKTENQYEIAWHLTPFLCNE